jgi:hypothetical protein
MATRIAGGSRSFVSDWLAVNGDRKSWNAVAIDAGGYWSINAKRALGFLWSTGYTISGPRALP